ncbi:galactokinase [Echinococcus multilocularis]|uniref:Galactokinase n=1 Tax=Echinococcus multilocularis TaxID=6211 RepID=A0A0S4MQU7_ECHMU|nr:galactokinase [Echinococcus multilocularis]
MNHAYRSNHCELVKMVFECEAMVVVVASGVRHCIATGQYRFLRSECEELAKYFKVRSLRDPRKEPSRLRELCAIEPTGATEPHLHLVSRISPITTTHRTALELVSPSFQMRL